MLVSKTNKVFNKPVVNYGEVVFRNDEMDFDLGDVLGSGGVSNEEEAKPTEEEKPKPNEEEAKPNTPNDGTEAGEGDEAKPNESEDEEDGVSDEEFADKLLETYNGHGFDAEGNIVDEEGKVIKAIGDIEEYKVDSDSTVVSEVQAKLGYEIQDENGQPKVYEDTTEGFTSLVEDSADFIANKKIDTFISEFPEVKALYNHIATGGSVEDFTSTEKDWSSVEVTKDNKEQSKNIIREDFKNKGFDSNEIEQMLETFEDGGKLLDRAKSSKQALIDNKVKSDLAKEETIVQQRANRQKEIKDYWDNAKSIITSGKLKNIEIPQADKDAFFEYVSKPVDQNGNSADSLARQEQDTETTMLMSYWRYKGYDLNKLVKSMVAQEKATSIKKRISTERAKTSRPVIKGKMRSADSVDIDIDKIT